MLSKKYITFFITVFLVFLDINSWAQTIPPTLTAIGSQFYCPLEEINIVTDFSIIPGDEEIEAVFIQISENYIEIEDMLLLTNQSSHPNITIFWSASEGKLTLTSLIPSPTAYLNLIAAVKDVVFKSSVPNPTKDKTFSITIDEKNYLPKTQHYYEYISAPGITWTEARDAAAALPPYYGVLDPYLATIIYAEEAQLCGEQATGQGWIGGSDAAIEGTWKWVTGPEAGMIFWNGLVDGSSPSGVYSNWADGEPNDWPNDNITKEENYAHIYETGKWNDYPNSNSSIKGYIVEYGGMPGNPILDLAKETKIYIPKITSTIAPAPICGSGTRTLSATSNTSFVLWFDALGTNLSSGNTYTTPLISTTTSYYALASTDGNCENGERIKIDVIVNTIPTITDVSPPITICGAGTATLTATASEGIINWYDSLGNLLDTGTSFTPASTVSSTTTYYVDATENGCTTLTRTPVVLNVQYTAEPTGISTQDFCDVENATLNELTITGTAILWYNSLVGVTPLNSTDFLVNNTIYYASQTLNGCESPTRLAVEVHIFETPTPPSTITFLEKCDDLSVGTDTDGFIIFDVTEKETEILNGQLASNFTITYFTDAAYTTQISNATAFPNSISGGQTIYVRITNNSNATCSVDTSFELKVNPLPVLLTSEVTLEQCDDDLNNDGFSFFNLNEANELISANYLNETFEFYSDAAYTQLITSPIAYQNPTIINSEVFVKISTTNSCERFSKILLKVGATQIPPDFLLNYYACEEYPSNNQDGKTFFDFSDAVQQLIDSKPVFSSQLVRISFFENLENALSETNPIPDISNYWNANAWNQEIYARIDSDDVNACLGLSHVITLHVEALPIANTVTINKECDDDFDGYFPFDISLVEATVLNGQTNVTVSYFDQNNNPLNLTNPFLTNSQTITIRVTTNSTNVINGACFDETSLEFIVEKKAVANLVPNVLTCDDDFDGLFSFDTSTIEATVLNGQTGMLVFYFDQNGNQLPSPLPNPFLTATQTITIRVENELYSNCTAETTFNFIVNPKPQFELDQTAIYCTNLPPIKIITYNPLGNYTYEWEDETGTIISTNLSAVISNSGIYTVIATSNEGCQSLPHQITIEASSIALLTENDITVVDDSDNNSITIATANLGIGDYEYALAKLDGDISSFQDEPYFDHLAAGIYTVLIQDKNDCGIAQLETSVVGFPKFFTPNNDGFNDTWNIVGINNEFYMSSIVNIFDRFGKLVAQINPKGNGWDGLFRGNPLPATDYWFTVELVDNIGNIRTRKGHFSLIRR